MAVYRVTAPDGTKYRVEGPDGATDEEVLSQIEAYKAKPNRLVGGLREAGQGATFGFLDEAEAGVRAAFSDEDYSTIHKRLSEEQDKYREEYPLESAALGVGGALATAPFTGGAGLLRALPAAGRAAKVGARLGLAAGEGALAGAGYANEGERLSGAGTGAALGGAFGAGSQLLGAGLKGATRQRVKTELGRGDDFIPLHEAAEDGIPKSIYGSAIFQALGSRLPKQTRDYVTRQLPTELAGEGTSPLRLTLARNVAKNLDEGMEPKTALSSAARTQRSQIAKDARQARSQTTKIRDARLDRTKQASAGMQDNLVEDFQREAIRRSAPLSATPEELAALETMSPLEASKFLTKKWKDSPFASVKDKSFTVKPKEIIDDATADLTEGLEDYASQISGTIRKKLGKGKEIVDEGEYAAAGLGMERKPVKTGVVSIGGVDLMEARNALRREANSITADMPNANVRREAYQRSADRIEDEILKNLDDAGTDAFLRELDAYGDFRSLTDAVTAARRTKGGNFTPEDWLGVAPKGLFARGKGRMQDEALDLQQQLASIKQREKSAVDRAQGLYQTRKGMLNESIADQKETLNLASSEAQRLVKAKLEKGSIFSQLAGTSAVSALPFLATGSPLALLAGVATASGLSTQRAQRAIAGQTRPQRFLSRQAERYEGTPLQRRASEMGAALRRGGVYPAILDEEE